MANEIDITIKATDKASATMKAVAAQTDVMASATMRMSQASQLATNITNTLQQAVQTYNQVIASTVGTTAAYSAEVSKLSRLTGETTEETSRVIQVFDDFGVSTGALTMAARKLSQDGLSPSVETLAQLSDQYNALAPGSERVAFLMDKFGRSGLDMARAMEQGGDALRQLAAEQSGSLILTQSQTAAYEAWTLSVDAAEDATASIAAAIGNALTPAVTDFNNQWAEGLTGWAQFISGATGAIGELQREDEILRLTAEALDAQGLAMNRNSRHAGAMTVATQEQRDAALATATAQWDLAHSSEAVTVANIDQGESEEDLAKAEAERVKAIEALTAKNQEYLSWVSQVAGVEQSNADTMAGLQEERLKLQEKYNALMAQGYRATGEGTKLGGVIGELAALDAKMADSAAKYEESINQMIAADLLKQLSTGGLTDAETAYYQKISLEMGLITQEQIDRANEVKAKVDELMAGFPGETPVPEAGQPGFGAAFSAALAGQAGAEAPTPPVVASAQAGVDLGVAGASFTTEERKRLEEGGLAWTDYSTKVQRGVADAIVMYDQWFERLSNLPPVIEVEVRQTIVAPPPATPTSQQVSAVTLTAPAIYITGGTIYAEGVL